MTGPRVVLVEARGMTAAATMPLTHLCPFVEEVDHGSVTLEWRVENRTLELHSVRDWLATFAAVKVSHEQLTGDLYDLLLNLGLTGLAVTTRWETAGGTVTVRA